MNEVHMFDQNAKIDVNWREGKEISSDLNMGAYFFEISDGAAKVSFALSREALAKLLEKTK